MKRHEPRELAEMLVLKAHRHLTVLRKFIDEPEIAGDILGFHAQQAAEKYIKAVLTMHHARYERTRGLASLVDMLGDCDIDLPDWLSATIPLTPYADTIRYEEEAAQPLDRPATVVLIEKVRAWAQAQVSHTRRGPTGGCG